MPICNNLLIRLLPIKPAAPVIRIRFFVPIFYAKIRKSPFDSDKNQSSGRIGLQNKMNNFEVSAPLTNDE